VRFSEGLPKFYPSFLIEGSASCAAGSAQCAAWPRRVASGDRCDVVGRQVVARSADGAPGLCRDRSTCALLGSLV
jgi:hypothetical protein